MFQQYLQTSLIRVFIFLRKRKAPKYRKLLHTVILTKETERDTLSPSEITLLSTLVKAIHHTESSTSNPERSKHAVWFQFICRAASSYRLLPFLWCFHCVYITSTLLIHSVEPIHVFFASVMPMNCSTTQTAFSLPPNIGMFVTHN